MTVSAAPRALLTLPAPAAARCAAPACPPRRRRPVWYLILWRGGRGCHTTARRAAVPPRASVGPGPGAPAAATAAAVAPVATANTPWAEPLLVAGGGRVRPAFPPPAPPASSPPACTSHEPGTLHD